MHHVSIPAARLRSALTMFRKYHAGLSRQEAHDYRTRVGYLDGTLVLARGHWLKAIRVPVDPSDEPSPSPIGSNGLHDLTRILKSTSDKVIHLALEPYLQPPQETHERITHTLPLTDYHNLMGDVSYAMAVDDVRYYLNGVFFHNIGRITASEGHLVSTREVAAWDLPAPYDELDWGFILENDLINIIPAKAKDIQLSLSDPHPSRRVEITYTMRERSGDHPWRIEGWTIDGKYPDYRNVLDEVPSDTPRITLDSSILSTLRKADPKERQKVRLHVCEDQLLAMDIREWYITDRDYALIRSYTLNDLLEPEYYQDFDGRFIKQIADHLHNGTAYTLRIPRASDKPTLIEGPGIRIGVMAIRK